MWALPSSKAPASGWLQSLVGVSGGIPTYPVFCDVTVNIPGSALLAMADGVTDDSAAINEALALCPAEHAVFCPAGDYLLLNPVGRTGSCSVVLRGAGVATRFLGTASSLLFFAASFQLNARPQSGGAPILSGNVRGSTEIELPDTTWMQFLEAGTVAVVRRRNEESGAIFFPGTEPVDYDAYNGDDCSQLVEVLTVETVPTGPNGGFRVTFEPALNEGYTGDCFSWGVSRPRRCGFEDFYVKRTSAGGLHNISISGCDECWVRGVESDKCNKWSIRVEQSYRFEARRNYVHDTWQGGGDSAYGIGFYQWCSNCLCVDNVALHCRHSFVTEFGGQGNVFLRNYSKDPISESGLSTDYMSEDLCHHGGNPRFNLWEGNIGGKFAHDYLLGGGKQNTFFRNRIQRGGLPSTVVALFGTDIQEGHHEYNLIGNVYDIPTVPTQFRRWGSRQDNNEGIDPLPESTAFLHGEVDLVTETTEWDAETADHVLPDSLYDSAAPEIGPDLTPPNGENDAFRRFADGDPLGGTPTIPTFNSHPSSVTVQVGDNHTFTASASGSPTPTLQWRKNGTNISGATSSSLALTNIQSGDAGSYDCVATNSEGTATSNAATLTVGNPVPRKGIKVIGRRR